MIIFHSYVSHPQRVSTLRHGVFTVSAWDWSPAGGEEEAYRWERHGQDGLEPLAFEGDLKEKQRYLWHRDLSHTSHTYIVYVISIYWSIHVIYSYLYLNLYLVYVNVNLFDYWFAKRDVKSCRFVWWLFSSAASLAGHVGLDPYLWVHEQQRNQLFVPWRMM